MSLETIGRRITELAGCTML